MRLYNFCMKQKAAQVQSQPYSNMAARKIVLIIGFVMTAVGFLATIYASLIFFLPVLNFAKNILAADLMKGLFIASMSLSFVGLVLSVAGANTMKGLARLSFFFGTMSFIVSAAFLVVVLFFKTFIPFGALAELNKQ